MSQILMDKEALLARLEAQRALAASVDAERVKEHRQAEQEFLSQFRAAAKDAAKWDYATIKERWHRSSYAGASVFLDTKAEPPQCPTAMEPQFTQAIERLNLSKQSDFTLDENGRNADLWRLVTWTPNPPRKDLCS